MKTMKRITAILFALLLAAGAAQASTLSLSGTVEAGETIPVYAPVGGTVEKVAVEKGMRVASGDKLISYKTEKIYATEDGTVKGVFAKAGDDAETVTEKYGADLYIEGAVKYTVTASISKAYSATDTTFVHTGEKLYVVCRTGATRTGIGTVTAVDGSNFTVQVTEGSFIVGDSVSLFRDKAYTERQRVGRGTIARANPIAVTGTGAVVKVAVKNGDKVKRGDLLMETLSGTFDGYQVSGTSVTATKEGVITSVSVEPGTTVSKGDVIAQIATISGMRVEASISADDRTQLKAGDKVTIELEADESKAYKGTVKYITELPEETESTEDAEVTYKAIISFKPDGDIYFGMPVVVTYKDKSDSISVSEPEMAETDSASEPATESDGKGE